jgi:hypothetical protein
MVYPIADSPIFEKPLRPRQTLHGRGSKMRDMDFEIINREPQFTSTFLAEGSSSGRRIHAYPERSGYGRRCYTTFRIGLTLTKHYIFESPNKPGMKKNGL